MAIKCTNILHCKTLPNLHKLRFLVWKYTIWQPCPCPHRSTLWALFWTILITFLLSKNNGEILETTLLFFWIALFQINISKIGPNYFWKKKNIYKIITMTPRSSGLEVARPRWTFRARPRCRGGRAAPRRPAASSWRPTSRRSSRKCPNRSVRVRILKPVVHYLRSG
jgi:hypothetical protein